MGCWRLICSEIKDDTFAMYVFRKDFLIALINYAGHVSNHILFIIIIKYYLFVFTTEPRESSPVHSGFLLERYSQFCGYRVQGASLAWCALKLDHPG